LDTLLISVLVSEGWTATKIAPKVGLIAINKWYDETLEWIRLNVSDEYKLLNGQWLFKNQKDAIMFILRWS
jgi:hypothetical protein